jgi:hypothetical protein
MGRFCVVLVLLASCASASSSETPRPAHEIVAGAARVRGGGIRMDVQVGHIFSQQPITGSKVDLKPAAVVAP